jgi:amino acid adenylation domain-containing protein
MVGEHAAAEPGRVAVEGGGRSFTYGQLDAAGHAIAAEMVATGVRAEEPVAVCLPRSWEAVVAFLGALRAGAAYVPINPAHPPARQRALIELAGARIALTSRSHQQGLPRETLRVDVTRAAYCEPADHVARANGEPHGHVGPPLRLDQLAYVLFTSGSTGRPKGVEITHRNLSHLLCSQADVIPRGDDAVMHVVPLDFDVSGLELWGALTTGARLVIAPDRRPDPLELGRLIATRGVTFLSISTGVLHELVRAALPDLGGLRVAVAAGDVLSPVAVRALRHAHPAVRVINGYGPTEATILASSFEVLGDEDPIPIGRPLPGYRLYVLDRERRPVRRGTAGELWIGGPGVARGYRDDAPRTAERFHPDPDGEGSMYRTGDRVQMRDDGELLFLGREDRQVKIAGQRVELGEIETVLASHPGVGAAAVVATEAVEGHKRLVAHVATNGGPAPSTAELRAFLERRLPRFMVPATFASATGLPLTDRGKVDHAALASVAGADRDGHGARPKTTADRVSRTMAELLGLDSVGADESLFDLGGDSLLAITLVGLLRERLGVELDIGTVFDFPTPEALADRIDVAPPRGRVRRPLLPGPRERTAPLSFAQRRAWLFGQMHPESIAYQFAALLRLKGPLDRDALRAALRALLERHEVLRTAFVEQDGQPVQAIHAQVRLPLEECDLRSAGCGARARLIRERVRARIDCRRPPLARWLLARLSDDDWAFLHIENHLTHDGWSIAVLITELSELYSARVEQRSPALPEPSVQFQDYARWERELAASEVVAEQVSYWKRALDPAAPLIELPSDRPRAEHESFTGGSIRHRMSGAEAHELASAARAEGATLFMAAFAAFAALAHLYTGLHDLQIGSGVANRTEPSSRELLGMIVNTVVLRVDVSGDPTAAELLRRVRRVALEAYANADAPFDAVVEATCPPRDPSRSPLFNVLFSFHDTPRASECWSGLDTRLVQGLPNGTAKADLNVIGIAEPGGALTFVWEHAEHFDDATVARFAAQHVSLMAQFARRPSSRLSELELVSEAEGRRLERWSGLPLSFPYERDATIAELFAERATESPDAIAVTQAGEAISYGTLDRRANRLAHHLRGRGIPPGARIGVCLERSVEMVVCFLAAAKAGAAYVPLDPSDPPARLRRHVESVDPSLVLTRTRLRDRVPVAQQRIACLEELVDLSRESDASPRTSAEPTDAAYVMFTSGSTGSPKGVEVPHRAIVRLARGADYVRLGPDETILGLAPPTFDASTFEIWGALLNGGRLVLAPGGPLALAELDQIVADNAITTLWLTAGLFHRVVDDRPELLRSVRQLLAGGDVLSPDHVRRALATMPSDSVLVNGYGPTEATTFSCTYAITPDQLIDGRVPIGRPVPGTSAYVLDRTGRTVPLGLEGELFIGGDGVALGYVGDRGAPCTPFVDDPFAGGRMYRTGDRVRWRPDGTLEFLGRVDRQVKIRGFRVEPAEIEETLRGLRSISDVHVAPVERAGDRTLAAYVVATDGNAPSTRDLRSHAGRVLPTYAVPSAWVTVPSLPLTANGKIDVAALPAPSIDGRGRRRRRRPGDRIERTLISIWERVLDRGGIGTDEDFFELGGHSLLAVEVVDAIDDELGCNLPLATIFEAPTVERLAATIRERDWNRSRRSLVAVKRSGQRPPLFCVCAGDGNATGFAALARRLPPDQPLYALQPKGLTGNAPLHLSIERAAAHYARQIRAQQRRGPYLLAGRCLGAFVAYEMAGQLEATGEQPALLAVLDSAGPHWRRELADGTPYDEFMHNAVRRSRPELDPFTPEGTAELMRWLAEPAEPDAPSITRYLNEVYRMRANLRDDFPSLDGPAGANFVAWSWVEGHAKHGLCGRLLPEPPAPLPVAQAQRSARLGRLRARLSWRAAEAADILTGGRRNGAPGRQRQRVLEASAVASDSYRAGPYGGVVTLIRSQEFHVHTMLDRWYALDAADVVEVEVEGSHRSMLREPDVGSLAERLTELIGEATR